MRVTIAGLLCVLALLLVPIKAHATSPYDEIDCSGAAAKSAICKSRGDTTNPLYGKDSVLAKVTNIVAVVAGATAVFVIVLAGGQFILSSGDSQKVQTARNTILYAVIGLFVIVIARSIIIYVAGKIG